MIMEATTEIMSFHVSRETVASLALYESLVHQWNRRINLVSASTLSQFRRRHIEDSVQLLCAVEPAIRSWVDFGSGAGLPGLPVAIVAREVMPELRLTLVESDKRKAAFLREAVRNLELAVHVIDRRIEDVEPLGADVISARAVSELDRLLELSYPHLALGGCGIFPKGKDADNEVRAARTRWDFECQRISSKTDADASVLVISGLRHG